MAMIERGELEFDLERITAMLDENMTFPAS